MEERGKEREETERTTLLGRGITEGWGKDDAGRRSAVRSFVGQPGRKFKQDSIREGRCLKEIRSKEREREREEEEEEAHAGGIER